MGKLHKIRQEYNQLTVKDKQDLAKWLNNYFAPSGTRKIVSALYNKRYEYKYYLAHLLRQDGIIQHCQAVKNKLLKRSYRLTPIRK